MPTIIENEDFVNRAIRKYANQPSSMKIKSRITNSDKFEFNRSHPRLCVGLLLLDFSRQQNFFWGGYPLDLGLKVPKYYGGYGKKI